MDPNQHQQQQQQPQPPPPQQPPQGQPADNNAALAVAIQALIQVIQGMQQHQAVAPAANVPILDPFASNAPFNLASRAGDTAFQRASSALDETWDGTVETFPSFIIALRIRSAEVGWNAAAPQGVVTIAGHNLFTEYHSITDQDITNEFTNRVNDRAVQNSKTMYQCIKASITGDLKATIFGQAGNLPTREDGPTLFKTLTSFTMVANAIVHVIF